MFDSSLDTDSECGGVEWGLCWLTCGDEGLAEKFGSEDMVEGDMVSGLDGEVESIVIEGGQWAEFEV